MMRLDDPAAPLAHSSGEWVSSDWPVCPVSETAAPHRMGAALTYARRYALFTLVGIAGEDDLDAPDLSLSGGPSAIPNPGRANGHAMTAPGSGANGEGRRKPRRAPSRATLEPEASAALREQLLADLAGLARPKELDRWAQSCLPTKNTLTANDARLVEEAFQGKLAAIGLANAAAIEVSPLSPAPSQPDHGFNKQRKPIRNQSTRSTRACWRFPSCAATATRTTFDSSPNSHA